MSKEFENISHIVDIMEKDKLLIALDWANSSLPKDRLEKQYINPEFFAKHFGVRVIQYFIDVIKGKESIGNCPVIIVLLKFFERKHISLNNLFIICAGLKNSLINYIHTESIINLEILKELERVSDENFEGVMLDYTEAISKNNNSDIFSKVEVAIPDTIERVLNTYEDELNEFMVAELKELEDDINNDAVLISFGKVESDTIENISKSLKKYGSILETNDLFANLGSSIIRLSGKLIENQSFIEDEKKKEKMTVVVEGFANDLTNWRESLFEKGIVDPNSLDRSIKSSIDTIIDIISGSKEEESSDMELF